MGLTKLFEIIAFRPMEAVESIITTAVLAAGLWLVSPLFVPEQNAAAAVAESTALPMILGVVHITLFAIWLYGMVVNHNVSFRRFVLLTIFCLYLFYGIVQIIFYGISSIPYVAVFAISFCAAITYIWLGLGDGVNGD